MRGQRTQVLSVHTFRRTARHEERRLQAVLGSPLMAFSAQGIPVPQWASGVRVEKAGLFSWSVTATEWEGR